MFCYTLTNKLIEATPESQTGILGVNVNEQEAMGFGDCILIHFHELFKVDIGCKILIDLFELFQINSLINNEVSGRGAGIVDYAAISLNVFNSD